MKIFCLLSVAIHPRSGRAIPSPIDIKAVALAQKIAQSQTNTTVKYIHCRNEQVNYDSQQLLQQYFGYGITEIINFNNIDYAQGKIDIYKTLIQATQEERPDLVICGIKSLATNGSGMLAYHLAYSLNYKLHSQIIDTQQGDKLAFVQYLPEGNRRTINYESGTVISTHAKSELTLSYAHSKSLLGNIVESKNLVYEQKVGDEHNNWQVASKKIQRKKIKVVSNKKTSAQNRMQQSIEISNKGGKVLRNITPAQGAEEIIAVLKQNKLI